MSWSTPPSQFSKEIREGHQKLTRKAALGILHRVVFATPVANPTLWKKKPAVVQSGGTARGNWQVSLDTPHTTPVSEKDANGGGTVAKGQSVIDGAREFPVIYIANNLPYIRALNYGLPEGQQHSVQAPLHFVELAVEDTLREL